MDFNSYWYLGLAALSLIVLGYVFYKKRRIDILFIFLIMIGLGYIIETVIYIFLNSYVYYPHLLKHNSYFDSNLGAIASNSFALPAAATYIAGFRKNWLWIVGITLFFVGVEALFLQLNIYEHNWWELSYTAIGLPIYFSIAKVLHQKVSLPQKGSLHFLVTYLSIGPISSTLDIIPIMFFSTRTYSPGWYANISRDTTAFESIYYLVSSLYFTVMSKVQLRFWLKYSITFVLVVSVTVVLSVIGWLNSYVWWDLAYFCFSPLFVQYITERISKNLTIGSN